MMEKGTSIRAPNGLEYLQPTALFINNEWVDAAQGHTLTSVNPATETAICSVSVATAEDVDKAVKAARAALKGPWKQTVGTARGRLLMKLADLIEAERETLATIEAMDNGKPYSQALGDVEEAFSVFRYYGGWADKNYGQTIETGRHKFTYTIRQPIGVCGQIIPWNYPLAMAAWKLGPCLACGNTSILKPAEQTPLSALYLANLIVKAGFPAGVVNILNGDGRETGSAIVQHPGIDKIAFTGSTLTGKQIMKSAAHTLKSITLETGGKSPLIIFDDADLDHAVRGTHYGIFGNMGQICTATSRLYVHQDIHDRFLNQLIKHTNRISVMGDPFDPQTYHGPQVSRVQRDKILEFFQSAREEGAKIVLGGGGGGSGGDDDDDKPFNQRTAQDGTGSDSPRQTPRTRTGYFIPPTIITSVTAQMRISREEIFGPCLVVSKFRTDSEVLEMANDSTYGLAATVYTSDMTRALRFAEDLEAGMVWVNTNNNSDYRVPFGGLKQSGIGRELGQSALEAYSVVKSVHLGFIEK